MRSTDRPRPWPSTVLRASLIGFLCGQIVLGGRPWMIGSGPAPAFADLPSPDHPAPATTGTGAPDQAKSPPTPGSGFRHGVDLASGAWQGTIPIVTPPGHLGLEPQLALTYSSTTNQQGLAGAGWDLPFMTIRAEPYDHDEPRYRLDGQRLLWTGPNTFHVERDSYQRVRRDCIDCAFVVDSPDGRRATLGSTPDARLPGSAWAIDRIEDAHGNYMTFSYMTDADLVAQLGPGYTTGGLLLPKEIRYTGSPTRAPWYAVRFDWTERPAGDGTYRQRHGAEGPNDHPVARDRYRLRAIRVVGSDGIEVRRYSLTYGFSSSGHSVLRSVALTGLAGAAGPAPYQMSYTSSTPGLTAPVVAAGSTGDSDVVSGDFDGDGRVDLVEYLPAQGATPPTWNLRRGGSSGFAAPTPWLTGHAYRGASWRDRLFAGDWDADGDTDLLHVVDNVSAAPRWKILRADRDHFTVVNWVSPTHLTQDGPLDLTAEDGGRSAELIFGDFTGDGRADAFVFRGTGLALSSYGVQTLGSQGYFVLPAAGLPAGGSLTDAADVDGDGKLDLVFRTDDDKLKPVCSGFGANAFYPCRDGVAIPEDARTTTGDFNGDGLDDLLIRPATAADPNLDSTIVWSGAGGAVATSTTVALKDDHVQVADLDGDDRDDLAWVRPITGGWRVTTRLARGDTFAAGPVAIVNDVSPCLSGHISLSSGDVTGDGRDDLLLSVQRADPCPDRVHLIAATSAPPAERLATLLTPTGLLLELDHQRSTAADNPGLPAAVPVVTEVRVRDFARPTPGGVVSPLVETHRYRYAGGGIDVARRELTGFFQVTDQTVERNLEVRTYHRQDFARRGKPELVLTWGIAPFETLTADYYRYRENEGPLYHTELAWHVREYWKDGLMTAHSLQGFSYDDAGNPTRFDDHGLCGTADDDRHTDTTYRAASSRYLYRPAEIALWTGAAAPPPDLAALTGCTGTDGVRVEATRNEYDHTTDQLVRGDLTRQLRLTDASSPSWETARQATYRADGLPVTTTDARGFTTTIVERDPVLDLYPSRVRNPLGHDEVLEYEPHFGAARRTVDANGSARTITFDSFGRPRQIVTPLSDALGLPAVSYAYGDGAPSWVATVTNHVDGSGNLARGASVRFLDALGRDILTVADGDADDEHVVSGRTTYWAGSDRPVSIGVPAEVAHAPCPGHLTCLAEDALTGTADWAALTPAAGPTATFAYDPLGRALRRDNPDGGVATYDNVVDARGFGTIATDEVGAVHAVFRDARGDIARVERAAGVTTYRHDARGKMTSLTSANGVKTSLDWDPRGRLSRVESPSVGTMKFGYDADGHEIERTDARGVTTTTVVDALGRPVYRSSGSGDPTLWAYDRTPLCFFGCSSPPPAADLTMGRPWAVLDASGFASFAYDGDGHLRRELRHVGGMSFTTSYQNWPNGQVVEKTWPNGDRHHWALAPDGQPSGLWVGADPQPLVSMRRDALGRPSALLYASGARTEYAVDPVTLRIDSIESRAADGTLAVQLDYGYRADGVPDAFAQRDALGADDEFALDYDADKRLTRVYHPAVPTKPLERYAYDADGRMTERQDRGGKLEPVGHDDASHPDAVTAIGSRSFAYDASGNRVERRENGAVVAAYDYDDAGRLVAVDGAVSADYTYDADGRRVREDLPTGTRVTVGGYTLDVDGSKRTALRIGDLSIGERSTLDGDRFFHLDAAGSLVGESDGTGVLQAARSYSGFGATADERGSFVTRRGFGGYTLDGDTDLYFAQARYYDPSTASFTQPDSWLYGFDNPEVLNAYAYGANSPYQFGDPSGHEAVTFWTLFLMSFAVRVAVEYSAGNHLDDGWGTVIARSAGIAAFYAAPTGLLQWAPSMGSLAYASIGTGVAAMAERDTLNRDNQWSGGTGRAFLFGVLVGLFPVTMYAKELAAGQVTSTASLVVTAAATGALTQVLTSAWMTDASGVTDARGFSVSRRIRYDAPGGTAPGVPSCGRSGAGSMPLPCEGVAR